jgi:4'-phosphopantetheinyl transferase
MNAEKLQWLTGDPRDLISPNEVHISRVLLETTSFEIESLRGILSADELARAAKFHFEKDQKKFIVTRGVLRTILGRYLGNKPDELRFEYTSFGKPLLATDRGHGAITFNLSHSDEIALVAVTRSRRIGIDVERIRHNIDVGQIANRFFSSDEIRSLDKLQVTDRPELFFQYWVRKEALIKAMGEGLSFPMEQCDVSSINGMFLSPTKLSVENKEGSCWHVQDLFPGDGYAAAIATEKGDMDISYWHYEYKP